MDTKRTGTIVSWLFDRGYGFISNFENGVPKKYYLHITKLTGTPAVGAKVKFNVLAIKQGPAPTAINAEILVEGVN